MPRNFLTLSNDDVDDKLIEAIAGREQELASYDANIEAYASMLADMDAELPAQWPSELLKFKGKSSEQIYAIGGTDEQMILASKLNHRDRIKMLHFTEQAEMRKSEAAYSKALKKLPAGAKRDAAIARRAAKGNK